MQTGRKCRGEDGFSRDDQIGRGPSGTVLRMSSESSSRLDMLDRELKPPPSTQTRSG